jgi:hypothetical protein
MGQRAVECAFTHAGGTTLQVVAPPTAFVAPPGRYLLFLVTGQRVPSEGRWIAIA